MKKQTRTRASGGSIGKQNAAVSQDSGQNTGQNPGQNAGPVPNPWAVPGPGSTSGSEATSGPELTPEPPVEYDRRGIALPPRQRVGGIITPQ